MYLKKIRLKNFRNYRELELDFHKKINIITGNNAQGKTNLLEGIYMLSLGKSFRTNKDSEMIIFDGEMAGIKGESEKNGSGLDVELHIGKDGKIIKIDGVKTTKNVDILENIYIVIFSPEDLKIVKDEPEKRRKFIDREICQIKPVYFKNLARYKKIVMQRNALLKEKDIKKDLLEVWNLELAEYGSKIMLHRDEFIKKLMEVSKEIHKNITNGKEKLEVYYESNIPCCAELWEQKNVFLKKVEDNIEKDIFRRTTTVGPHKDDLKICVNGIDIRHFGSQGQQRTAALSLKLAELKIIKEETGEEAILLLDDVLSELDQERQSFLINSLGNVQLFITTTEISEELKKNLPEGYTFVVKNGKVENI
ncbi:MAG: DNA replication/repair protein RecF [Anaerovorax sp.]